MRTDSWPPCVVTAFDLIGTRGLAASGNGSSAMIEMHNAATAKINHGLPLHSHGYIWNDSVLLLSYMNEFGWTIRKFIEELNEFKSFLEKKTKSSMYAISVKGLAFPQNQVAPAVFGGEISSQPRAIVLKTSSWAMANCFLIEKELGRYRADWYIDARIMANTNLGKPFASEAIQLLPKKQPRTIHMYKGDIRVLD